MFWLCTPSSCSFPSHKISVFTPQTFTILPPPTSVLLLSPKCSGLPPTVFTLHHTSYLSSSSSSSLCSWWGPSISPDVQRHWFCKGPDPSQWVLPGLSPTNSHICVTRDAHCMHTSPTAHTELHTHIHICRECAHIDIKMPKCGFSTHTHAQIHTHNTQLLSSCWQDLTPPTAAPTDCNCCGSKCVCLSLCVERERESDL